jgi:hypothetical protein
MRDYAIKWCRENDLGVVSDTEVSTKAVQDFRAYIETNAPELAPKIKNRFGYDYALWYWNQHAEFEFTSDDDE